MRPMKITALALLLTLIGPSAGLFNLPQATGHPSCCTATDPCQAVITCCSPEGTRTVPQKGSWSQELKPGAVSFLIVSQEDQKILPRLGSVTATALLPRPHSLFIINSSLLI